MGWVLLAMDDATGFILFVAIIAFSILTWNIFDRIMQYKEQKLRTRKDSEK